MPLTHTRPPARPTISRAMFSLWPLPNVWMTPPSATEDGTKLQQSLAVGPIGVLEQAGGGGKVSGAEREHERELKSDPLG